MFLLLLNLYVTFPIETLDGKHNEWIFCKQGRLEPVEVHVKNNKRGLGVDEVKKKAVKTEHANASKGKNKQVLFILLYHLGFIVHFSILFEF